MRYIAPYMLQAERMAEEAQEKDDIQLMIEACKRNVEYFSNANKKDREIRIVKFFLDILRVNHQEKELIPAKDEPPDVLFRDARFEIKEILPKNSRRDGECKESLGKAETAKTIKELWRDEEPQSVTLNEIMVRIEENLQQLSTICPTVREGTDLLLYVYLATFYKLEPYNIPQNCKDWRSVSICTNSKLAIVLFASQSAPDFIRVNIKRLIR